MTTILSLSTITNIVSVSSSPSFPTSTFLNDAFAFQDNDNKNKGYNYNDYYSTSTIPTAGNSKHQQVIDCSNDNVNVNGVESNIDTFFEDANNNNLHNQMQDFTQDENTYNDNNNNRNDNSIFENKNLLNICANLNLNNQRITVEQQPEDDNVYVIWRDNSNGGDIDVFFRVSNNNGQTFNPVIDLSNNDGVSGGDLQMLVSGNNVYVVWTDESNGGDTDVFFRTSNNNGQTFNPFIDLSDNDGDSHDDLQMLVSGNNVYVIWYDRTNGGDRDVFFRASNNNGQTFNPFIDLSDNNGDLEIFPQMLVSGNNVYVVWEDNSNGGDFDIFFRVSNNNGQTFNPFIDLSSNNGESLIPQMLVSGNNVYVIWDDRTNGGDRDVFF
ncbi:MAG TPA: sialidase family protein, partial [Nitrososphaeraceae archaeon]|nr:sialidase family protein [Nitrososphaeraceae archaeon]